MSKIKKEMEISSYLRLIEDVNIMKNLIFNEKEISIFNSYHDLNQILNATDLKLNELSDKKVSRRIPSNYDLKQNKFEDLSTKYYKNSFCVNTERLRKLNTFLFNRIKSKFDFQKTN